MRPLLLALLLGVSGCIPPGVLVAEDGAHRLMARDRQSGITVVLTTDAWDGYPADFDTRVTVIHALIANMGTVPILLAPGDLELRDVRGFRHELLDAGGTFRQQAAPGATPAASQYSASDSRGYDPGRSRNFGTLRGDSNDVHRAALPWGVLLPGTQMRGFLYFDRIEGSANQGRLVWHLGTADHKPVVDLAFDLHVARPRG